jgi:hypothetical protein
MTDLPASQDEKKSESRIGLWLSLTLGAAIIGLGSMAIVSTTQLVRARFAEVHAMHVLLTPAPVTGSASRLPEQMPGFQRRGSSLIGEFRTKDGQSIRLVIDARTHTVIGVKVLEGKDLAAAR